MPSTAENSYKINSGTKRAAHRMMQLLFLENVCV